MLQIWYYVITMVRTQIQLTEAQARKAKDLARKRGVSMAEVIRQAIDAAARDDQQPDAARKRAANVVGCVQSGLGDLSTNHDAYLDEAFTQ